MSEPELQTHDSERPERAVFVAKRVNAADLKLGDGRTVDVRVVPYGETAEANDGLGGLPVGIVYRETIMPGAFDHQLNAANRVHMNVEHEPGISGKIGFGVTLASRSDGLYGSFRFLNTPAGDTALELVREGALGGVSFEATFKKSVRSAAGLVQRVKANLVNIALCRDPAYENALILGLRMEDPEPQVIFEEDLLPLPFDYEIAARQERLGIDVPEYLKAHPDVADTPSDEDTSEIGTRQDNNNPDGK
jgi:HK97 family phage prohead protease